MLDKIFGKEAPNESKLEEEKLFNWIKNKVEEVRSSGTRQSTEAIWMSNIAALLGFDGYVFDSATRSFRTSNRDYRYLGGQKIHVNDILPTVQNRVARLSKSRPKYQVKPNSNDEKDKNAARLAEQILEHVWQSQEMDTKHLEALMWMQQCGHAYYKICWDSSEGKEITDPVTGEVGYEGDIRIDVVSGFEVFPDPKASKLSECAYLIQAKVRSLDYFRMQYPEKGELVKEEDAWLLSIQYEQRVNSLNNRSGGGNAAAQMKNSAIELVYYEKRSKKHPRGRMVVSANGVILEDKELPVGEIPFVKLDDILVGGKYYSESIITHLRPIQEQKNRLIRKRAEWTNRLLTGKVLAARGSGLAAESLNDQSGEVVYYDQVPNAGAPQPIPMPSIPAYAYNEEAALDNMRNEISGINEVSRGQGPGSGITAAIAMAFLTEQDDTRIGIISRRIEKEMAKLGGLILKYVQKFYITPRIIKVSGQSMEYAVKDFVGADLYDNTDVHVIEGSTLPGSLTAKRDYILTFYREGLLGDPADPKTRERVAKLVEFGDLQGVWKDYGLDMTQIQRDIDMIKRGEIPEVNEFDNHELHFQEKNSFRKSDEFLKLDPEKQGVLLHNMEMHLQAQATIAGAPDEIEAFDESPMAMVEEEAMNQGVMPPNAVENIEQNAENLTTEGV